MFQDYVTAPDTPDFDDHYLEAELSLAQVQNLYPRNTGFP